MRILLVEDDHNLSDALSQSLTQGGFVVDPVYTGQHAITAAKTGEQDIIILDLGLPDIDGLKVLQHIRDDGNKIPVIVLTARDQLSDKVKGLDTGADDYLAKPFELEELVARLRVMERRLGTADTAVISINDVVLDTRSNHVQAADNSIALSRREWMLLKALMESAGRILSKAQLESKLYEWGDEVSSNTIEVHVHHLRKKLPKDFIKTVRGVGYIVANG